MSKLTDIISKIAPVLGSVIPLPGASLIMNLIGAAFGGASSDDELADKIASDPDAAVKLREIEDNTKVQLQQIIAQQAINQIQSEYKDRDSARNLEIQTRSKVPERLVTFLSVFMIATVFCLIKFGMPGDDSTKSILYLLIGQLSGDFKTALNFFFGASASSDKKDDMIFNSTPMDRK